MLAPSVVATVYVAKGEAPQINPADRLSTRRLRREHLCVISSDCKNIAGL